MEQKTGTNEEPDIDLNNRTVTLIFLGFLAICGVCFVTGYVMGNGTTPPSANYADMGAAAGNSTVKENSGVDANNRIYETVGEREAPPSAVIESSSAAPEDAISETAVFDDNTGARQKETQKETPNKTATAATAAKPPVEKIASSEKASSSEKTSFAPKQSGSAGNVYSVQVAAFRARREAEIKGRELDAKGFKYVIEPPSADDFYRVKVGSFATRAEAGEMANRLKKSGFDTMIRENK